MERALTQNVLEGGGRSGHWGLPGIRERAMQIGTQMEVRSEVGVGTEIHLSIPGTIAYGGFPARSRFWLSRNRTGKD